jgi:flagellar motor switch/type III secretory pathway protein FliN
MPPSPFPFHSLPRLRSAEVVAGNAAVAWLGAISSTEEVGGLEVLGVRLGGWRVVEVGKRPLDSSAAMVWIEREGARALVALPGEVVRQLARRLLASPPDLAAPRPLTSAEQAVAAMLVATALARLAPRVSAEPWQPFPELRAALAATEQRVASWPCVAVQGEMNGHERALHVWVPPQLAHRRPARGRALPSWCGELSAPLPVVVAAAPMEPAALDRLAVRDVIVVEAPPSGAELRVGRGAFGLRVAPGEAHAVIESGYLRRVPLSDPPPDPSGALADDVTVELTVTLGTTALSLRQLAELSAGQVISLGRPLHGPFELHARGRLIGSGELVDVDGALGVRVASLLP